jgi:hypothetical protein
VENFPLELTIGDFTAISPPLKESERFNLVICNPPYVRHHHLTKSEKARLEATTRIACGVRIGGLASLYCHFMGLAHGWMADDGIAGWLIPSEFMDVNYGMAVKRYLIEKVELLQIHRFKPSDLQFQDALVSSAVVWFRKRRLANEKRAVFSYGGNLTSAAQTRTIHLSQLRTATKWSRLAEAGIRASCKTFQLSDFFSIKRGLATGDNAFFIMSAEEIAAHNLPKLFFKPILPSPRYLQSDIIEAEADGTPKIKRQQYMLDCRLSEDDLRSRFPKVWDYLETGKPRVSGKYLCRHRTPWYTQEQRPPAPFICTYMGRNLVRRGKPFRFILNLSAATAANVYLLLYPRPDLARALVETPELFRQVWKFLNSIPPETLIGEGRVYGGGLYKLEPKELGKVPADEIATLVTSDTGFAGSQAELFD